MRALKQIARVTFVANSVFGGAGVRWTPLPNAEAPTERSETSTLGVPTGETWGDFFAKVPLTRLLTIGY